MKTPAAAASSTQADDDLRHAAMAAHGRADYARALQIWADLHARDPNAQDFYGAIATAKAAGSEALTGEFLRHGQARFRREAGGLARHAAAPAWEAADRGLA